MIIISHRGNITGRLSSKGQENTCEAIENAIALGYHVEIDIFKRGEKITLGHDIPQEEFSVAAFIAKFYNVRDKLWIHCKNIDALIFCADVLKDDFIYFGHSLDEFVLTSNKCIFTCPNKLKGKNVICVMPELIDNFQMSDNYYGILTDYPEIYEKNYFTFRSQR